MPGDPLSGSKVWKASDREIGKPWVESWKSNRTPGLAADGSFPRPRESLQPSVPLVGCRWRMNRATVDTTLALQVLGILITSCLLVRTKPLGGGRCRVGEVGS